MPEWDDFEPAESDWSEFEPVADTLTDTKGRRRVELLGKIADVEKERISAEPKLQFLEWADQPLVNRDVAEAAAVIGAPALNYFPGVRSSVSDAAAGLTTPVNLAMLAAGGAGGSIPKIGSAIGKGIAGGFGAHMATEALPEAASQAGAASVIGTEEDKQKAYTDLALTALMSGLALKGATPGTKGIPPRIPEIMDQSEAAANRAAVNLAAPGTVRETEIARFGPPETSLEAPPFQLGEMPFEAARRFGTTELPPVEILPQSGRLSAIEILDEPRSLLERETRGKASFGAEAPTLTRTALPIPPEVTEAAARARESGLSKAAEAAEEVARGENRMPPYRAPKELTPERVAEQERKAARESVEEGLTMEQPPMEPIVEEGQFPQAPGMPGGTLSRLQSSRIQAGKNVRTNQRNNPPSAPARTTEDAWRQGYESRTPEGIANLETQLQDATSRLSEALKNKQPTDALLKEKQLAREALSVAKGDTENTLANEWIAKNYPDPVAPIENIAANAGTKSAYDLGSKITTKEQLSKIWETQKRVEGEALEMIKKADADADLTAASDVSQRAALMKEAIESSHGLGAGQPFDKTKISLEEYNARMASEVPLGNNPTPQLPKSSTGISAPKDIISKLEDLKFGPEGEGKVFSLPHPDAIKAIGKAVWDDAIDLAIGVIKAGRAIGDAVDVAIQHIKKHVSGFSDSEVRANLDYVLKNETKASGVSKSGATTPPGSPTPTPAPTPGAPSVPPTTPPATPPTPPSNTPPAPTPPGAKVSLDDVYKRFEIEPKAGPSLKERAVKLAEAFRTGFSSSFRPLNKLAEDIAKTYGGTPKDVAGIFEQLKGSSGKAEADVYRFEQDMKPIAGAERDFNAYMFLNRAIDRLNQDAATGQTRRKVAGYTLPDLQAKLAQLESDLGTKLPDFKKAADAYQQHLDQALQQQVTSGRMSVKTYEAIKDGNQFYAPFKVAKWFEETMRPEGSGRRVDTTADYTKAMEGIEDQDFQLGDMMAAARQNIALSRILAEKNQAMQQLADLAPLDLGGDFILRLKTGQDAPRGMEAVNVMENGQQVRYAVNPDVATAIQMMGPQSGHLIARMMGSLFRAGATSFNIPFQVSNLLADVPRQALVSKYGVKAVSDIVRYPMDMIQSLYATMTGNYGGKNQLFLDFLDSGAAGTTVQQYLTPDALKFQAGEPGWFQSSLNTAGKFADAIEQMSKVVGVKRAMREHGVTSGKDLAQIPEAITEIRRFSGSPDFGRMGKWTDQYRLNLLYMFLNARIQGTVADLGRLTGRDGAGTAAKTWGKVGLSVGLPTVALYLLNNSKEYRDDYAKRPEQEKRNYWLIPKDSFIETDAGEKMRDYWRIPKREIAKWTANIMESGMDFASTHDPEGLQKFAIGMTEELSPVNIQGNTATERLESIGGSLNPMIKAPLEAATGRDMYRHKNIIPDRMKKASPEQQYTDRTPEVFRKLAETMPDVAPEIFRSPLMLENMLKNVTAGLFTQFLPRKPVKGRSNVENAPLLQRFQAVPYTDSTSFDEKVSKFEREAADDQLNRYRTAQKIFDETPNGTPQALVKKVVATGGDEKLAERVLDLYVANKAGVTSQERRILNLPVEQRAQYLAKELEGKDAAAKTAMIRSWTQKRILTTGVAEALAKQGAVK